MATLALIWRAAGMTFATDVTWVVEVLPPLRSSPVPGVPRWVRGLFSLRGDLLPLIDARLLVADCDGGDSPEVRMRNRIVVVRCAGDPQQAPMSIGLFVDEVVDLDRLDFRDPHGHPGFETSDTRFLGAAIDTRWGQVQRVEPNALLTPEQSAVLAERLREAAA